MNVLKSIWQGIAGIVFGCLLMGAVGFEYVKYWLHLGPKPTNWDFD